jgi:hypothetical protein
MLIHPCPAARGTPPQAHAFTGGEACRARIKWAQVCAHGHRATPVRLSSAAIFAGELGVWVTAVQPLPEAVSKVVGLVRTAGGHCDHFLAQMHSLFHISSIQHCLIPDARGERPAVPTGARDCAASVTPLACRAVPPWAGFDELPHPTRSR